MCVQKLMTSFQPRASESSSNLNWKQFPYHEDPAVHATKQIEPTWSWEERLYIALNCSHGIEYLSKGAVPMVIQCDLKSANILLDCSMRAKVS
uniref:Putative leucine-rich repeat receptor-like serine/threonine-protein kinase At5g15730 isoform X3 n=1 Tax=Rhizophora mucronata TaxID=61149 RepID=A0A2P2MWK8_RHIMU